MSKEGFANWRLNLGCNSLLFDGASKGNPRLAGAGGVIFFILEGTSRRTMPRAWAKNPIMGLSGLL